jgi:hypothetical protein
MRAVDAILALVLTVTAVPLEGQEPAPPARRTELGLMGFSARGGVDFDSAGQAVVSVAVDLGYLLTPRMRLRPSGELGFLGGDNTYVGGGLGLFGRAACGSDPGCPHVWLQFSLGFELRVRPGVRWLIEYHPENAFRRQRVFVGLATDLGI